MTRQQRIRHGDVFEFRTPRGLAYLQYVHDDPRFHGPLIRVLPGLFELPPRDLGSVVAARERFWVFFPLGDALARGVIMKKTHAAIPEGARAFPVLRMAGVPDHDGRVLSWWLWDGQKRWRIPQLTMAEATLSIAQVVSDKALLRMITTEWSPLDEADGLGEQNSGSSSLLVPGRKPSLDGATGDRAVLAALREAGSDLERPHAIDHTFAFRRARDARAAIRALREKGYTVSEPSKESDLWLVSLRERVGPTLELIERRRREFEELGRRFGGDYGGWGAAVAAVEQASGETT